MTGGRKSSAPLAAAALAVLATTGIALMPHSIPAQTTTAVEAAAGSGTVLTVAEQAARASAQLREAVAALEAATSGRAQVSALTQTVRAYEEGLAALREAIRQAELRETSLKMRFHAKREQVGQMVAILARMEQTQGPLLLLHPSGPVGTAQSGMMLAEIAPAIQAEAEALKAELQEISDLRALQQAAGQELTTGLSAVQTARSALSKAISERRDLPKRFTEDPEALATLLENAETLDDFSAGLVSHSMDSSALRPFVTAMGVLDLPVIGTLIRRPDEPDPFGHRRPGMALATRPRALVSAPWPGTIRYLGPLLDYGNVIVLEPGDGYLMVLAGLGTVYGEVGEVVAKGAPLGLMGGEDGTGDSAALGMGSSAASSAMDTETLYLELRLGATPVDPTGWFAATSDLNSFSTGD